MTQNVGNSLSQAEVTQEIKTDVTQNQEEIKKKIEELQKQATELRKQIPRKAKKQVLPMAFSDDDFVLILKNLTNRSPKEIKVAFLLSYESGLRIAEVKNLKKDDIDLNAKSIFVRQGKYSKDRVVPLPKTWKNYMFELIPIKSSIRTLERQFKNAVKHAGLRSDLHYHHLRHSFATHCLDRGMPIHQLQILLGHSNVVTTNVYIRANPRDALATYEKVF